MAEVRDSMMFWELPKALKAAAELLGPAAFP